MTHDTMIEGVRQNVSLFICYEWGWGWGERALTHSNANMAKDTGTVFDYQSPWFVRAYHRKHVL